MSNKRRRPPSRTTRRQAADKNRRLILIGAGAAVALAVVLAVALGGGDGGGGSDSPPARVETSGAALPPFGGASDPAAGDIAPTLRGVDFAGEEVAVVPDGTPKVVIFLAHWCPHCQREVPRVQEWLDEQGEPEGVDFYSVSTSVDRARPNHPPERWLEREGWTVPVIRDEGSEAATAYGLTGFPYFVFLDGENRVVGRASGELSIAELESWVRRLRSPGP